MAPFLERVWQTDRPTMIKKRGEEKEKKGQNNNFIKVIVNKNDNIHKNEVQEIR